MIRLTRDRCIALAILSIVLFVSAMAPALALRARWDALETLSDEEGFLKRLTDAQHRANAKAGDGAQIREAPAAAFLNAQTPGLATAQLEAYFSDLAQTSRASLASVSALQADQSDAPDIVRIQANIDIEYEALQSLLYKLEAGTPYVFVDMLKLRPASVSSSRPAYDSPMKVTLGLRAIWRQSSI